MKISRRAAIVILLAGVLLFLAILFRTFVLENLLTPLAVVLWMIWRVIISIDQVFYWGILILGVLIHIYMKMPHETDEFEAVSPAANAVLENVNLWRVSLLLNADEIGKPSLFKRNLGKMITTIYTLKLPGTSFMDVYDQLMERQIAVPETIYAFLFSNNTAGGRRSLRVILQNMWQAPRRWMRHWSGRDTAEYYEMIAEVITFMESLMENDDDSTNLRPIKH